jgi:hypothetical protein
MRKIWDQIAGDKFAMRMERERQSRKRRTVKTEAQREAEYVLRAMRKGLTYNVVDWRAKREATKRKKERMREAFSTLREFGMI